MSEFISASSGGDTRLQDVFQKLERGGDSRFSEVAGEDLQYPLELGDDEYNQFILFTMYDHETEVVQQATQRIVEIEAEMDAAREAFIKENTQMIVEFFGGDYNEDDFGDAFLAGALSFGLAGADAPGAFVDFLQDKGLIDSNADISLSSQLIDGYSQRRAVLQQRYDQLYTLQEIESAASGFSVEQNQNLFEETTSTKSISNARQLGLEVTDRRGRTGVSRLRINPANKKAKRDIALYIPNKIVNNGTINYNSVEMGGFRAAKDIITKLDMGALFPFAKRKSAEFIDSLTGFAGINLNSEAAIQQFTGLAINPRIEQLFDGVPVRSFDFSFSLAPRSREESIVVSNIIRTFRSHAHPRIGVGGHFLNVPSEFEIRYYKVNNEGYALENLFLNKIGRCSLTNINVDYTPNNINSTFENGSPVRTNVTMTFTELRPLTKEDIEEGF